MSEIILTRIQRCHYCGREVSSPPLQYEQNPFCKFCLAERTAKASPRGSIRWRREGNYVIAEVSRKLPPSARKHRQL